MLDYLSDLRFYCFAGLLLQRHENKMACSLPVQDSPKIKTEKAKRLTVEHIHNLSLLFIERDSQGNKLLLEPLYSSLSPSSFAVVPTHGNHNIIGEPMIVDCFIRSFGCFSSYAVEVPVKIRQIYVCRQRTKRATLRHPYLSGSFDHLFHEPHDLRNFDSSCNLVQEY